MATLQEVQKCELDILKSVVEVCDRHHIDYYLAFGTMLGAVRHKGFIPWDDDIDIYVKQSDMKKLKKYCQRELPEKYFWQDQQTDVGVPILYTKIRNTNTLMYGNRTNPEIERKKKITQGIWIDILPMFKEAKNEKLRRKQVKCIQKYQLLAFEHRKLSVIRGNHFYSTIYMKLRELFIYKPLSFYYHSMMMLLQSKKSKNYLHFGYYSIALRTKFDDMYDVLKNNLIPKELLDKKKYYDFEDTHFTGFAEYDRYLTISYGADYMTPIVRSHVDDYSNVIVETT